MAQKTRTRDVFPMTQRTWLGRALVRGSEGLSEANHHIMEVYAHPLKVYFLGSSFRSLGEPDDVVQGFFADRLAREGYLDRWIESDRPLRYWLIVGFKHFLFERSRELKRSARAQALPDEIGVDHDEPESRFHREAALAIASEAMRQAHDECERRGQGDHWNIFVRHYVDGLPYEAVGQEFGVTHRRAAVMARTASNRFRASLRELVSWNNAAAHDVDAEIRSLLETIES
ncbi:MAG: sigma-70 family RNA polymerase sigma factor [Phycisphaerales bacterium]|nr:sigma-70 family RNA polymerase sigma factor [Phycisphaerales bacterium]